MYASSFRRWRYGQREPDDEESFKLFLLLAAIVAFIVATFYSWIELKYLVLSQTVPGEIVSVRTELIPARGGSRERLAVQFRYETAKREAREGTQLFSPRAVYAPGDRIEVQYFPVSEGPARIAGTGSTLAVVFFSVMLLWMIWSIVKLARDASAPYPRSRSRSVVPGS